MCNNAQEVRRKMLLRIGTNVHFRFPIGEGRMDGILEDRCVIPSNARADVSYWDVVDLITFTGEPEKWIRIGYYRQMNDGLRWGSQTTIAEPVSVWKKLLIQTAREKEWFRELLKAVCHELDG